jgi:glycosyltransferase involved in cell wall biosynthesis
LRIGIDCQALQTPNSRQRGIGIYTLSVLNKLILAGEDEYHLFFSNAHQIPTTSLTWGLHHTVSYVEPSAPTEFREANEYLQWLAYESHDLELLHVASPMEGVNAVINPCASRRSFPVVGTLYDLIPLIFSGEYLSNSIAKEFYLRRLQFYQHADLVLAISENTRQDAIRMLGLPASRVVNISGAADPSFKELDRSAVAQQFEAVRKEHGIRSRFLLYTGGFDFRKNLEGTIRAFSLLPQALRQERQIVIVCHLQSEQVAALEHIADQCGIKDSLVLTNYISQESLILLYNYCDAFVFPSLYEGFGLPVLEAMSCGAPVIASNTSSIPEIMGDAGIQVDPTNPGAVAGAIELVLGSENLRLELRHKALERAKLFNWEATARRTREGLDKALEKWKGSAHVSRARKPKIAFFSPLPPQKSGISDYSAELLPHLAKHFEIDVYLDGYEPTGMAASESIRFLTSTAQLRQTSYYSWLFQMGNSSFHAYMYEILLQHSGITVLHDFCLHDFIQWLLVHQHRDFQRYVDEMVYAYGEEGRTAIEMVQKGELSHARVMEVFPLNERALSSSKGIIVHSESAKRALLKDRSPHLAARVRQINQGMVVPAVPGPEQKDALKRTFAIPEDAFVIGTFGIMAEPKQLELGLRAIQRLQRQHTDLYYIGVGRFLSPGYEASISHLYRNLGLTDRVAFVGHVDMKSFYNYLFVCDVVLSLRHPSRGETSAAMLRAMSCGVPTIVNDVAALSDLSGDTVIKLATDPPLEEELLEKLGRLIDDKDYRDRVGAAARQHIIDHHAWESIAKEYADFIDRVEATGLGDKTDLCEALAQVANKADPQKLAQLIEIFAANEQLGRVLWV